MKERGVLLMYQTLIGSTQGMLLYSSKSYKLIKGVVGIAYQKFKVIRVESKHESNTDNRDSFWKSRAVASGHSFSHKLIP